MKEILRIYHGKQDGAKEYRLRDYNLELYEGQIMYIQGLFGSGVKAIIELLSGERPLLSGDLYIGEKRIEHYDKMRAAELKVYTITEKQDLISNMTVAENLEVVSYKAPIFTYYRRKQIEEQVECFLKKEQAGIHSDMLVEKLSMEEARKLSLLKAKIHGARLIVMDCTRDTYEGHLAGTFSRIIKKMREEGIAFLILSERYSSLAEIADRVQLVYHGRDEMEWHGWSHQVQEVLEAGYREIDREQSEKRLEKPEIIGFYDYEWEMGRSIWEYLQEMEKNSPGLWQQLMGGKAPIDGVCFDGHTAVMIKECSEYLVKKLSVEDNIILTVPGRVGRAGIIKNQLKKNICRGYYEAAGVSDRVWKIQELTRVQKKILALYRWEIAKPKVIVIENPYWGMDQEEEEIFRGYLKGLPKKGIRLVFFSRFLEELRKDCDSILTSHNGKIH